MKTGLFIDLHKNKWWFDNDLIHRKDGPAIEWNDGDNWWYLNGYRYLTIREWIKANDSLTTDEKILFRLTYD